MKITFIILFSCILICSCKHADKMTFVKNVLNNPDSIEVYLQNSKFTSKRFLNYYLVNKEYKLKQIKKSQELF